MEPKDLLKLKIFGFPEYTGHAISAIPYEEMTALQLAYIYGACNLVCEHVNKVLESRFDADRGYLLTEFGKLSVEEFSKKIEEEYKKIEGSKNSKLEEAFNFFTEKYKLTDETDAEE